MTMWVHLADALGMSRGSAEAARLAELLDSLCLGRDGKITTACSTSTPLSPSDISTDLNLLHVLVMTQLPLCSGSLYREASEASLTLLREGKSVGLTLET